MRETAALARVGYVSRQSLNPSWRSTLAPPPPLRHRHHRHPRALIRARPNVYDDNQAGCNSHALMLKIGVFQAATALQLANVAL